MLPEEILKRVHRKFAKDIDYPETGSEDLMVRIDHLNDGVTEWENKYKDGIYWSDLVTHVSLVCGGTGTDLLPADFLSFIRKNNEDDDASVIVSGGNTWVEVTPAQGKIALDEGLSPYFFWREGENIVTIPALSGTVPFTYLRKATRYSTGTETTEPEMRDDSFLEDYALSKVFLDNSDNTLYTVYATSAKEKLDDMVYAEIGAVAE